MTGIRRALLFAGLPVLLLPAFEGALWVADGSARAVGGELAAKVRRKLAPLDGYPERPEEYLKIAVFGESAAVGAGALRAFDALLEHELRTRAPGKKVLIKKFAANGNPFHGFQAELLKREFDRYDVFLVYSGLAESMRYFDESGVLRAPERKAERALKPLTWRDDARRILARHSRAYAFYSRLAGLRDAFLGPPGALVSHNRFQLAPDEIQAPLFPKEAKDRFVAEYGQDMREIARLAAARRKQVLVAGVIIAEPSLPHFSVLGPGTSAAQGARLRALLAQGTALVKSGHPERALAPLKEAAAIDDGVAIVDFRLGQAHWAMGRRALARRHFQRSAENDGFPFRHVRRLNLSAAQAAEAGQGFFRYIDTDRGLGALVERGYSYEELFNDMEHPTLVGHAFLAQEFLCRLEGLSERPACPDWTTADLRAAVARYREELRILSEEEAQVSLKMAQWHLTHASMTAYPEEMLASAQAHLDAHRGKSAGSASDRAACLLLQSWIDAKRGRDLKGVAALLNEALALAPAFVRAQWLADSGAGRSMEQAFRGHGVHFDPAAGEFTSPSSTRTTGSRAGRDGSGTARSAPASDSPAL